jgi:hypothetical protein
MIRNSTTRICSANEKNCTENAKNDFEAQQQSCGCLVPCNYVKYEFERNFDTQGPTYPGILRIDVKATFESDNVNNIVRKQQFNELDFLSYIGGLLGLFAGFSVLSFIELIYWFLIRVCLDKMRRVSSKVVPVIRIPTMRSRKLESFSKHVKNYLNESSIHGLSYLSDSQLIQRYENGQSCSFKN